MDIKLTVSQEKVLNSIIDFVDSDDEKVFVLKGYAGTGKTTLMRFLVKELGKRKVAYKLLASTGRAAKVLHNISQTVGDVSTIHSLVYSFNGLNKDFSDEQEITVDKTGQLFLVFEPVNVGTEDGQTVYIVDESSMISDVEVQGFTQAQYGSGRVLKELLEYDQRKGSKFIFVGDPCQLPPLEEYYSPALMPEYISREFGLKVRSGELTEIMRQAGTNSIITASRQLRSAYASAPENEMGYGRQNVWGKFPFRSCRDIILHDNLDIMMDDYVERIKKYGYDKAVCLCRSNKACYEQSLYVRRRLGLDHGVVCKGDLLMVVQNNILTGLMNGDLVVVQNVSNELVRVSDLTLRRITVKESVSGEIKSTYIIEDILKGTRPNLDNRQQNQLFVDFIIRMQKKGIRQSNKMLFNDAMYSDPILNALRCVYGYSVTCHKAQGGEWDDVYVHVPRNITRNPVKATYQWMYTAITRAKNKLHMVDDFYIG